MCASGGSRSITLNIEENGMADFFMQNALYIVLFVVLVIWFGIFAYLFRIDRKVRKLEQETGKEVL